MYAHTYVRSSCSNTLECSHIDTHLSRIVHNEAEAAWCASKLVQPHDDALRLAHFAEDFIELRLSCVEGQITDIHRSRVGKCLLKIIIRARELPILILLLLRIHTYIHT